MWLVSRVCLCVCVCVCVVREACEGGIFGRRERREWKEEMNGRERKKERKSSLNIAKRLEESEEEKRRRGGGEERSLNIEHGVEEKDKITVREEGEVGRRNKRRK